MCPIFDRDANREGRSVLVDSTEIPDRRAKISLQISNSRPDDRAGIPDHPVVGRLGAFAENTRSKYVVAAWWPVPTAVVLGIGYQVDGALLELMTAGDLLNDAPAGAIVYPVLWLAALYAPIKVFSDGSVPMRNWRKTFSRSGGGVAGAASRGGGGAASSAATRSAAVGGAAGALAAGAGAGTAAASSGSGGAFSRLNAGSSSQRTLSADGGLQTMNASSADGAGSGYSGAKAIGGGFGPSSDAGSSAGAGSAGADTNNAYSTGTTSSGEWRDMSLNESQNVTTVKAQDFDSTQRYEPYTYHDKNGFQRLDPPKSSNWLTEKGGIQRLNEATDEPLRFKGEDDSQMYDLRRVNPSGNSYGTADSGAETIRGS